MNLPLESIEMGILIGWHFHPKWMVQIGIERQQLTERLSWENVLKENFLLQSDSATYYLTDNNDRRIPTGRDCCYSNNKSPTYPLQSIYTIQFANPAWLPTTKRKNRHPGKYWWNILTININFRVVFLNQNDEILSNQFAKEANFYRNNLSWAMQAGLGISYSLYDKGQLALDLTHRQWFQSFTRIENAGYQQKYNFTGISLGYRIIL